MRSRDGDAVVLVDERRIDVRAVELWDAQIPRRDHLRIVVGDRGRDNDGVRPAHVLRTLSVRPDVRAEAHEFLDDGR